MFSLFGKDKDKTKSEPSLLDRLKRSVERTRSQIAARVEELVTGEKRVDAGALKQLENSLLAADLGVRTTRDLVEAVRLESERAPLRSADAIKRVLKAQLMAILQAAPAANAAPQGAAGQAAAPYSAVGAAAHPEVVFIVGVNGTGKTTTIGKLAYRLRHDGRSVLLCAGDTFRAAAIEQLAVWAQRTGAELIHSKSGADPSAVLHDALTAALARSVDVLIVDTAGRLHTKSNLMAELEKMRRTASKLVPGAPHDVLLVMDATTGQNGLTQAREFTAKAGVTGIVLTKLDGTAKGGIVVAITRELGLPVRFVGTGESAEDLVPFDAETFVTSLFE
ncbi:MAG: signal recognition particle-docking protein FtsY [Candidatus Acidiferrales bacterium]|jgi:fused signal recognition particle receptor